MRDKWLKIAGLVLAIVAVLVIAAFVLAKTLITPERVRSVVLSVAEDSL
ncbi:MAG: hypothetical protein GWN87_28970, partial [Desulfuromonadales bacterium]|nr:hypothetical protein [Desulfuromonadales bacterium]NIS43672.1 hypothetical protein [Desulfuromonadales bacterium]